MRSRLTALLALLVLAAPATAIPPTTIYQLEDLTAASSISGSELLLVKQSGASKSATASLFRNYVIGATQSANTFLAGPTSGGAAAPAFRVLNVNDIPNALITYAKLQDVSAASRLLGRGAGSGSGVTQEIQLGTGLSMSGATLNGHAGDVTSVTCNGGLTGGTFTTTGTCAADFGSGSTQIARGNSTTNGVTGSRYSPERTPTSGLDANSSDEFIGSINTGLYTWGNQGTATVTAELDTLRFHTAASASRDRKVLWYAVPSATDFVMSTKTSMDAFQFAPTNVIAGLAVLETGSIATPTSLSFCTQGRNSSTTVAFTFYSSTSYTAIYTGIGSQSTFSQMWLAGPPVWLQFRYVNGSKALSCWASFDGFNFSQIGSTRTLGAGPVNIGLFFDQNTANVASDIRYHFLRTRTDATGTTSPYPPGQ